MNPPTLDEARTRSLIAEKGIHTFSNGSEWECWADNNCFECRSYDMDQIGLCAFVDAALMHGVSPALALLFGWTQHADYPECYEPPKACRFFAHEDSDNDGPRRSQTPPVDPRQLVLLADPTEDAAMIDDVIFAACAAAGTT